MSENTINTIADETAAAIESTKAAKASKANHAAPVEEVAEVEQAPSADLVIESLLEQFAQDAQLTAYQIHVVANLAFEILEIEVLDSKTGEIRTKQIAPQYVYNKTKSLRARKGQDARFDLDEVRDVLASIVGGTSTGTISSKDRLDKGSLKANALKALKG